MPVNFGNITPSMFRPSTAVGNLARGGTGGAGSFTYVGDPSLPSAPRGGGALLPGQGARAYEPAYGGIPGVPNPAASQSGAIMSNLSNLPGLYNLTTGLDTASGAGAIGALNQEIPGVSDSIGSAKSQLDTMISGKLPKDVIDQIAQQSAEIGAGRGMGPMAGATNASYLRALGLTSLGETQQGLQGLNSLMGAVPRAPMFDPASMTLRPEDMQQWNYLANVLRAAPEPGAAARQNLKSLQQGTGVGGSGGGGGYSFAPIGGPNPGYDSLGFRNPDMGPSGGGGFISPVGAINPQSPIQRSLPPGINQSGWSFDPTVGAYVNQQTGQVSDTPGGAPWEGFSAGGMNTPASPEFGSLDDYYGAYPEDFGMP